MVVVVNVFNPSGSRWISTIEANQDYIVKTVSKKKKKKGKTLSRKKGFCMTFRS